MNHVITVMRNLLPTCDIFYTTGDILSGSIEGLLCQGKHCYHSYCSLLSQRPWGKSKCPDYSDGFILGGEILLMLIHKLSHQSVLNTELSSFQEVRLESSTVYSFQGVGIKGFHCTQNRNRVPL